MEPRAELETPATKPEKAAHAQMGKTRATGCVKIPQALASLPATDSVNTLLANAKLAENGVEQILCRRLAHYFADGVGGDA